MASARWRGVGAAVALALFGCLCPASTREGERLVVAVQRLPRDLVTYGIAVREFGAEAGLDGFDGTLARADLLFVYMDAQADFERVLERGIPGTQYINCHDGHEFVLWRVVRLWASLLWAG